MRRALAGPRRWRKLAPDIDGWPQHSDPGLGTLPGRRAGKRVEMLNRIEYVLSSLFLHWVFYKTPISNVNVSSTQSPVVTIELESATQLVQSEGEGEGEGAASSSE